MTRILTAVTLVLALTAMGKPLTADPMPHACDVLHAIDIAATLGANTTYAPITQIENQTVRMSLCSADTPDLSARMTLMVRENLAAQVPDAMTLRDQTIDVLRATIGQTAVIEHVNIGDASIWVGEIGQLTVWHRAGRVMFIFSPTPMQIVPPRKPPHRRFSRPSSDPPHPVSLLLSRLRRSPANFNWSGARLWDDNRPDRAIFGGIPPAFG